MTWQRLLFSVGLFATGLMVLTILLIRFGGGAWHAMSEVTIKEFCVYLIAQVSLTISLTCCWWRLLPRRIGTTQFCLLIWSRMLRDAAGEFLPFSYAGGLVISVRALVLSNIPATDAAASTVMDMMVEAVAEILFMTFGLLYIAETKPDSRFWWGAVTVLGIAAAALGWFLLLKYCRRDQNDLSWITSKIIGPALRQLNFIQGTIDEICQWRANIALALIMHSVCAVAGGTITWFGFHILGSSLSLIGAIAFEALIHIPLTLGFFVPARIGLQEVAYVLLGAFFGIPSDLAISLSLLRRARNFAISLPVLMSWQFSEARTLVAHFRNQA